MGLQRGKIQRGVYFTLALSGFLAAADAAASAPSVDGAPAHTSWTASVREALSRRAHEFASATHAWTQKGVASWYGGRFSGRRNAQGGRFNQAELTAAHPTAPIGSKLLVESEETGRSVVVTVNDRGPYARGRIIDLSHAAAAQIGMLGAGVAHVKITPASGSDVEPLEVAQAPER